MLCSSPILGIKKSFYLNLRTLSKNLATNWIKSEIGGEE